MIMSVPGHAGLKKTFPKAIWFWATNMRIEGGEWVCETLFESDLAPRVLRNSGHKPNRSSHGGGSRFRDQLVSKEIRSSEEFFWALKRV